MGSHVGDRLVLGTAADNSGLDDHYIVDTLVQDIDKDSEDIAVGTVGRIQQDGSTESNAADVLGVEHLEKTLFDAIPW